MLKTVQHQNVFVDFHGWYESEDSVFLAMEYFDHGDLTQYIRQGLTERDAQVIGKQLLEGLAILHGQNWAHRDLKPQNIFVVQAVPSWWVKIGDFGISKRLRDDEDGTNVGTYGYMAPEADSRFSSVVDADTDSEAESIEQQYRSSVAVDMWSLGCVLYQIPTKALPFPANSSRDLGKYYKNKLPFPQNALLAHNVSQEGCAFIQKLMKVRPQERLTAKIALQEPWITAADDYELVSGAGREDPEETRRQSEFLDEQRHLQSMKPTAAANTAVEAPRAPPHPPLEDVRAEVETLRLGGQLNTEQHERAVPRKPVPNSSNRRRSTSSSAESFYFVPTIGGPIDYASVLQRLPYTPPPTTTSGTSSEHNSRLPNQVQDPSSSPKPASVSSPPKPVSTTSRERIPRIGIALWNFVKVTPNDLGLKQFDIVRNIRKKNDDWWYGTNDSGEAGVFPSNYIGQTRLQAEALFDYEGEGVKDINLIKEERLTNITISTPGWWTGTNSSGERGHFPGNYVKLDLDAIKEDLNLEPSLSNGHARHTASPPGPNPRHDSMGHDAPLGNGKTSYKVGRALKDYKAKDGTIAFEHGELITNIELIPAHKHLIGTTVLGQRGEIPHDLVDIAADTVNSPSGWTSEDRYLARDRIPPGDAPSSGVKAVAVKDYRPDHGRGMLFDIGHEVVDIERSTLTWWYGRVLATGTRDVFPKYTVQIKSGEDEQSDHDGDESRWSQAETMTTTTSSSDVGSSQIEKSRAMEGREPAESVGQTSNPAPRRQGLFGRFTNRVSK